jgi:hypothetical protein
LFDFELKLLCKICERNKKTEKEKEENEIKIEKGPREPLGPEEKSDPQPTYLFTEPLPSSPLFPR